MTGAETPGPLEANYRVPRSFYVEVLSRLSLPKTLWWSARLRGAVLVGRGSRVHVHRTASVRLAPGAVLMLGLTHDTTAGAVLRMRPRSRFDVTGRVQVMRGAGVTVGYDAHLSIGAGSFLNDGATLVCEERVEIGRDCAISWGARVLDTDVHQLVRTGRAERPKRAPVQLGDHCWVGANAAVLKGVQLGADCVVAAGSVVTRSAAPGQLLGGNPATVRAEGVTWRH